LIKDINILNEEINNNYKEIKILNEKNNDILNDFLIIKNELAKLNSSKENVNETIYNEENII